MHLIPDLLDLGRVPVVIGAAAAANDAGAYRSNQRESHEMEFSGKSLWGALRVPHISMGAI
jgi:hypothetical protein